MKYFIILLIAFSFQKLAWAINHEEEVIKLEKDCLQDNKKEECEVLSSFVEFQKDKKRHLKIVLKSCELNFGNACTWGYTLASKIDEASAAEVKKFLKAKCETDLPKICEAYADILVQEKKEKESLKYYLKSFNVDQDSRYAFAEYNYGSKNKAFAAALSHCQNHPDICGAYYAEMPDHPQRNILLKKTEEHCLNGKLTGSGASCEQLAVHSYKKDDFKQAFIWIDKGCLEIKYSQACRTKLVMETTVEKKEVALKAYCKSLEGLGYAADDPIDQSCLKKPIKYTDQFDVLLQPRRKYLNVKSKK